MRKKKQNQTNLDNVELNNILLAESSAKYSND